MNKLWSHLPNAHHIDWVLESAKTHDKIWARAWVASYRVSYAYSSRDAVWSAAVNKAWNVARDADRCATWYASRGVILNATPGRDAVQSAVLNTNLVLVAYDDCDEYLQMSYEQLLSWAHLSEQSQAVLLLPMKWVQEHEHTMT